MNRKIIGKISSSLIKADASYIPFHKYNPLINYDWSTKNINGLRYLTDKGKSPRYDAQLYFGQGVYFNGVDQGVGSKTFGELNVPVNPPEVTICAYISDVTSGVIWNTGFASGYAGVSLQVASGKISINSNSTENATLDTPYISGMVVCTLKNNVWSIYINGILKVSRLFTYTTTFTFSTSQVFTIGAYRVSSQYCTGKIKDVSMFTRALTQSEITQSYEQPEAFYSMAQADATCVLNMPMCENDGYVRNMKTYNEVNYPITYITSSGWNIDNGVCTIVNGSKWSEAARNYSLVNGEYYVYAEILSLTGKVQFDNTINANFGTTVAGILFGKINVVANKLKFVCSDDVSTTCVVKNLKIFTASGINPILNYTTACRTSAKKLSYGLQTCKFNRDKLGVINSFSPYLIIDSLANDNIKLSVNDNMLSNGFTFEYILKRPKALVNSLILSSYNSVNSKGLISNTRRSYSDNRFDLYLYDGITSTSVAVSLNDTQANVTFTYNKNTSTLKSYKNGLLINSIGSVDFAPSNSLIRMFIENSDFSNHEFRLFKIHDKALTQAEITRNYNSYVAKGLLA
jgi:hypothetical protein